MLRSRPYVVTVMRKWLDNSWDTVSYRYSTVEDMIYYAGYYVDLMNELVENGEILDYQVSY